MKEHPRIACGLVINGNVGAEIKSNIISAAIEAYRELGYRSPLYLPAKDVTGSVKWRPTNPLKDYSIVHEMALERLLDNHPEWADSVDILTEPDVDEILLNYEPIQKLNSRSRSMGVKSRKGKYENYGIAG